MQDSVWTGTLAAFREQVGGAEPVPAGVAISAVSASLALALLAKVLDITGRRKDFSGDRDRINALIEGARTQSARLTGLADEDTQAFQHYLECLRGGENEAIAGAMRKAIEVPMEAARAAVEGLAICAEAGSIVHGLTAADLGIAASLLSGAVLATLISVDFNLREISSRDGFGETISPERRQLEEHALRYADVINASIRALLG